LSDEERHFSGDDDNDDFNDDDDVFINQQFVVNRGQTRSQSLPRRHP